MISLVQMRLVNNEHTDNRFAMADFCWLCQISPSFYCHLLSPVFLSIDLVSCHSPPLGMTVNSIYIHYVYALKKTQKTFSTVYGALLINSTNSNTAHGFEDLASALCSLPLSSLFSPNHFRLSVPIEKMI